MKKKLLFPCLLLTVAMLFTCVLAFGVGAAETLSMTDVAAGTKTPVAGDVVTISSAEELKAFSKYVSDGGVTEDITFRLEADVVLTVATGRNPATNLNPVGGTYNGVAEAQAFKGTFDGNGKSITNLQITASYLLPGATSATKADGTATASSQYAGLFAKLDGATVKDLSVAIHSADGVAKNGEFGVIASYAKNATITGCTVTAVEGGKFSLAAAALGFGGVVGLAEDSAIDSCSVNMKATGVGATAGVIAKAVNTSVRNCVIGGEYIIDKQGVLGGIVAELTGTSCVENCYSYAKLTAAKSATAGSVIGGVAANVAESAWVANCFSAVTIDLGGTNYTFGSLVGANKGTVSHSFGLRGVDKQDNESHNDIGLNEGVIEEVYAYQPQTGADGATNFVVGSVVVAPKQYACTGGTCEEDTIDPDCTACGGDGLVEKLASIFVPTDDPTMASLDGALNAWVAEKASSGVTYASWMINGDTIVNCAHPKTVYRPYDDQAPTCNAIGHGDVVCVGCDAVLQTGVEIPVDPTAHASADGKIYSCVAFECIHCHENIVATAEHAIDATKQCMDQTCTRCHQLILGNGKHAKPEDFDESKPCAEYACTVCATVTHDVDHDAPEVKYNCQQSVCAVCEAVVHKAGPHFAGLAANCERAQLCLDCGEVINPAKGHKWGEAATCGKAQMCDDCGKANPDAPATGEHVGDREAPTCTQGVYCVVCAKRLKGAAGHKTDASAEIDCGHGKSCTVCRTILESATGEHTVDWSAATVIRPATADRTGIVEGECTECGRKVEAFTLYQVSENTGVLQVYGASDKLFAGTKLLLTYGKVKNYANVTLTEGYVSLQAATATAVNAAGDSVNLTGSVTVKLILNKSASKMAAEKLKVFQVKDGVATELTVVAVEDGYVTFTANGLGEFIIAGEKTAAFETLGSIQPKQTAALIGTPAYEKKDEI